jgi:hypothetical protein
MFHRCFMLFQSLLDVVEAIAQSRVLNVPLLACQETTVFVHRNIMTKIPASTKGMRCRRSRGRDADGIWNEKIVSLWDFVFLG